MTNIVKGDSAVLSFYLQLLTNNEDKCRLEKLYRYYGSDMYVYARSKTCSNQDAEDAVHETFLKICTIISTISDDIENNSVRALILIILRNTIIDQWRKTEKESLLIDEVIEVEDTVNDMTEVELNEVNAELARAISQISEEHKEMIFLHYSKSLSIKEISGLLNISEPSVKSKLVRARRALHKRLSERGVFDETK